ncbi:MAG: hypothetical protein KIT58_00095 [Planctomycetota bacterium]|nr:hypothetical protein [Planctomycetota bacterium]
MKVEPQLTSGELKLYDKYAIHEITGASIRSIEEAASDPDSPLKWTHRVGRRKCADAATLKAYLDSLRV